MKQDNPWLTGGYMDNIREGLDSMRFRSLYMNEFIPQMGIPEQEFARRGPASFTVSPYSDGELKTQRAVYFKPKRHGKNDALAQAYKQLGEKPEGEIVKQFVIPFEGVNRGIRVQAETSLDGERLHRISIAQVKLDRTTVIDAVSEDEVETVRVTDTYGVTMHVEPDYLPQIQQAIDRMVRHVNEFNATEGEGE